MTDTTLPVLYRYAAPVVLWTRAKGTWALAVLPVLAFGVVPWLGNEYWLGAILVPVLVLSLAGVGLNLVTGYAGQISLGSGGFMAIGAFSSYALMAHAGINFPTAVLLGGLVTAVVGAIFGLPATRIKGFYLMVSTLAAQFFFDWLFLKFPWFYNYNSSGTISVPNLDVLGWKVNTPVARYYLVLFTVMGLTWLAVNLTRSQTGRNWMAIRDMDMAASVTGIRVGYNKILAFSVSSFYLGVAGSLWVFVYLGTAGVQSFGLGRSFQILFIIIIGGLGSIGGNFIGAAFISLLPIGLDSISHAFFSGQIDDGLLQNIQKVVFGLLIILLLIKEPDGIARLVHVVRTRLAVWPLRF